MSTEQATLPDKLSELIRHAVGDLEKCEIDGQYEIDMNAWHLPNNEVCHVCLAGSVMAQTLEIPASRAITLEVLDATVSEKMCALNEARKGNVKVALEWLGISQRWNREKVTPYADDPTAFKAEMLQLAADLEAAGL